MIRKDYEGSQNMPKKYKSSAMASIHEIAEGLYKNEIIDKKTMREFDDACLNLKPISLKKPQSYFP